MNRNPILVSARTPVRTRVGSVLLLVTLGLGGGAGSAGALERPSHETSTPTAVTDAPSVTTASPLTDDRVLLVGTGGITWEDVSAEATPTLWAIAEAGAVGNLVDRSVESSTCPADGWLAISAGKRAGDWFNAKSVPCRLLQNTVPGSGSTVPAWDDYLAAVSEQTFGAAIGTFGDVLVATATPASAVGPGAAIALATSDGVVAGSYAPLSTGTTDLQADPDLREIVGTALDMSELVVVDPGSVRNLGHAAELKPVPIADTDESPDMPEEANPPGPTAQVQHAADVAVVDAQIGVVLDAARAHDPGLEHTTVVVASLSEASTTARMQVVAVLGRDQQPGILESRSTRQDGYVQTTDVLPTIAELLSLTEEIPRGTLVGSSMTGDDSGAPVEDRVSTLVDDQTHALATRPLLEGFFLLYCAVNLLLFGAVSFAFSRRFMAAVDREDAKRLGAATEEPTDRSLVSRLAPTISQMPVQVLTVLRGASIIIAGVPVATLLANLTPWWTTSMPTLALTGLVIGWVLIITAAAVLPPWRAWLFGPVGVVATITAVVLAVDVATGAHMQVSALMGIQPTVAGRFYGFNNTAFALFATTTVLVAAAVANRLVASGHRRLAAVAVLLIGTTAVVLDGSPSIGADFGGPPALVPAFAILALVAAGIRLDWKKVGLVLIGALVVVSGFAALDWMRPEADRTHLGRFVDTVLDGGLLDVIVRKLEANFKTLRNPLALVGIAGIAVIGLVLGRPLHDATRSDDSSRYRWLTDGAPLKQINNDAPMFGPGVLCVTIALVIGTFVNDSGIVVLAVGMSVLVPLVAATYASWMLTLRKSRMLAARAVTEQPG
ncbi:hypothetical protein [Sanguibacter antarcticus]|uniref:Uncharacterized protein n=1 Tax=Sanguibacter antarcticus TaxID=372484 RepID=A0A2A9E8L7_9MICO|nr:hypothetical protein [Sanguibacter antarcticus]PFG34569.1 hypothetical protein ATL42_2486 [Sanguibacter antarcticus]